MKVDQITYTKRHNEGNFNYSEYSVVASLEEKDDVMECYNKLKHFITEAIDSKTPEAKPVVETVKEEPELIEPKEEKPKAKRGPKPKSEKVEAPKEDTLPSGQEIPPVIKTVSYNRENEAHKNQVLSYLGTHFPNWKNSRDNKEEIKNFMVSLQGQPFLTEGGDILPSFHNTLALFFNA